MRFPFFRNRDSVKNGILISIRRTGDGFHPGLFNFMYDEYETIYIHAGRFIPEMLNDRLLLDEEDDDPLMAVEEMIKGEGNCGIIIKQSMYDRNMIYQLLEKFYKR